MSSALARLRDYFRDPLLVRVGRDLELTPRGKTLIEPVRQMLLNAHAVLGSQALFDPSVDRRTFTLLSPECVTLWLIRSILRRLQTWAPGIRIQVERPSAPALARLCQGNVDLLMAMDGPDSLPVTAVPEALCSAFVSAVRYVGVVAADHPDLTDQLTSELFLRLPHIVVRTFRPTSLVEETVKKRFGVELDVRAVTDSVLEVPHLVAGTSLIGVVPKQLAHVLEGTPDIKVMELPDGVMPVSRLDMLWHRSYEPDAGHVWMRGVVLNQSAGQLRPVSTGMSSVPA